jgi:predicted RNase H-like nuclease (RuvC/YqgF family)
MNGCGGASINATMAVRVARRRVAARTAGQPAGDRETPPRATLALVATKKGNGHDPGTAAIVEVLERIEREAQATNERLGRIEVGLGEVRGELIVFKKDVDRALTEIHHAIEDTNVRVSDTNERLGELKGEVHGLRGEVHELRGEVHATNTRLDTLTQEVRDLRQDVREAHALRERVTKTEAAIIELRAAVFRPTG